MRLAVILPAAGRGQRFHADRPADPLLAGPDAAPPSKVERDLAGQPVFLRALEPFLKRDHAATILLAVHPDAIDAFRFRWQERLGFHGVELVAGGTVERWETVSKALARVPDDCTHVAIHDAARPLTTRALVDRCLLAAERHDAVIPACAVRATVKRVTPAEPTPAPDATTDRIDTILGGGDAAAGAPPLQRVAETVDRRDLVEVQTPQVFSLPLLRRAYQQIADGRLDARRLASLTDDAQLVEWLGEPVYVVEGEPTNLKITHPSDLELAAALIEKREAASRQQLAARRLFGDDDD